MNWKQPITTDCLTWDLITRLVFFEIMIHARNEDMKFPESFMHGNHRFFIQLKRGQCIFSIDRFSKESQIPKNRVVKSFELLTSGKLQIKLQSITKSYGMEITIENYDEAVNMKSILESNAEPNQKHTESILKASNKSEKNAENEKSEKEISIFESFKLKKEEVIKELSEKYPARDVPKAWKLLIGYYETHDSTKITDWKKHFEMKVQEDKFKSFTITPRFKPQVRSLGVAISGRELSPAEKEKAHRNALRIKEIALSKKKSHRELTREERIAQLTGVPIPKKSETDIESQFSNNGDTV